MTILYLAHSVPYPPSKGEKIRAFHQIRELARAHRVHLVCGIEERDDVTGLDALAKLCASVQAIPIGRIARRLRAVRALVLGEARSASSHSSAALGRLVKQTLRSERFDVILVSSVAVAKCVQRVNNIPKALDFVDVDSELWRATAAHRAGPLSWLDRLEARRLACYEVEVARCFDHAIFVSKAEARTFGHRAGDPPVAVVGNGVDLDAFAPDPAQSVPQNPPEVVFTGTMDYFPNVDAVRYFSRSILPRVRDAVPQVRLSVVGRNPTRAVRRLTREHQVSVTGWVPDVRPHLARATVAVAPLRIARGIQNKILEAMASGVPVVATSVALEGLETTDGDGVRRADDPSSFAREVVALLRDPAQRAWCSGEARRFVEEHHRWDACGAQLSRLLEAIVEKRGSLT